MVGKLLSLPAWQASDLMYRLLILIGLLTLRTTAAEPPAGVTAACFSPDATQLLCGGQNGLRIYAWPSLDLIQRQDLTADNVHQIVFAPDHQRIAVAGGAPAEMGLVTIHSWPELKQQTQFRVSEDVIWRPIWTSGAELLAASFDGTCSVLNLNDAQTRVKYHEHSRSVTALQPLTESVIATAGLDHSIRLWSLNDAATQRVLDNHTGPVTDLALHPTQSAIQPRLASASEDQTVRMWYPLTGLLVRFVRLDSTPRVLHWTPDGKRLLAACDDGRIVILDPLRMNVLQVLTCRVQRPTVLLLHPHDNSFWIAGLQNSEQLQLPSTESLDSNP